MWTFPPPDPAIEITLASHGMSKGVSQTDHAQMIVKPYLQMGEVQIGGQWKNVNSNGAKGEASAFVGLNRKFDGLQLSAGATYKALTGAPDGIDADCIELTAGASQKFGRAAMRINAIFSPNDIGSTRRSLYVEAGPSFDLAKGLRLSANVGHRWRQNGVEYTSMNAGAAYTVRKMLTVDLRYYRTNRAELGDVYKQRLVLSGKLAF